MSQWGENLPLQERSFCVKRKIKSWFSPWLLYKIRKVCEPLKPNRGDKCDNFCNIFGRFNWNGKLKVKRVKGKRIACSKYIAKPKTSKQESTGVLGKLGPGRLGPSPIWRQIGPRTFWGPICHFLANWAPANWAPADWAPANWAPANWAPGFYIFVLDIFCQQLGDMRQLEGSHYIRMYSRMYIF